MYLPLLDTVNIEANNILAIILDILKPIKPSIPINAINVNNVSYAFDPLDWLIYLAF